MDIGARNAWSIPGHIMSDVTLGLKANQEALEVTQKSGGVLSLISQYDLAVSSLAKASSAYDMCPNWTTVFPHCSTEETS